MLDGADRSPRTEVRLRGCAPAPLASYLKALGVLRLVAEQADPRARGYWQDDSFILVSRLDDTALEEFLLDQYRPTPLVAPWGGRSGFYPGSSEGAARAALQRIEESDLDRLTAFRETIVSVRELLQRLGMTEKVRDDAKLTLLRACRAELPDHVLPWLDACYVLTDEDRAFPPLLGTGGNEGSGSYVSGFAQQVVACIIDRRHDDALASALFATSRPGTGSDQTPGQFSPFAGGGPNATTGFEGGTVLNAWDFLLCLEGTLLFAAAATKRLEASSGGALAYPFTVRVVGAGAGGVALGDEANARAETWFPLWDRPATLAELSMVLAEGRVQVSGRSARDALDFARAVASLGLQRGITSFQRYGYLQRFGRNVIAVPIDRVEVRRNARGELADDLDHNDWLERFRNLARRREPAPPARLRSLVARLEDALFELMRVNEASRVQNVLIRLGEVQAYLARSPAAREAVRPTPRLRSQWVRDADDGSPEFRIAAALAGVYANAQPDGGSARAVLPMQVHFAPIDERYRWVDGGAHNVTWGPGSLTENLRALAERRLQAADRLSLTDAPWMARASAGLDAIAAWLDDALDETRIQDLLQGLVLAWIPERLSGARETAIGLPPAYAVLKPMFAPREQAARVLSRDDRDHEAGTSSDAEQREPRRAREAARPDATNVGNRGASTAREAAKVVRLLAANRVAEAVDLGVRRLRSSGAPAAMSFDHTAHPDGRRLLGALLVPLSDNDLHTLVRRILPRRDKQDQATSTANVNTEE